MFFAAGSSNGRTEDSESSNLGSNPGPAAKNGSNRLSVSLTPLDQVTADSESNLAYFWISLVIVMVRATSEPVRVNVTAIVLFVLISSFH